MAGIGPLARPSYNSLQPSPALLSIRITLEQAWTTAIKRQGLFPAVYVQYVTFWEASVWLEAQSKLVEQVYLCYWS